MAIGLGQRVVDRHSGVVGEVMLIVGFKSGRKVAVVSLGDGDTFRSDVRDLELAPEPEERTK